MLKVWTLLSTPREVYLAHWVPGRAQVLLDKETSKGETIKCRPMKFTSHTIRHSVHRLDRSKGFNFRMLRCNRTHVLTISFEFKIWDSTPLIYSRRVPADKAHVTPWLLVGWAETKSLMVECTSHRTTPMISLGVKKQRQEEPRLIVQTNGVLPKLSTSMAVATSWILKKDLVETKTSAPLSSSSSTPLPWRNDLP